MCIGFVKDLYRICIGPGSVSWDPVGPDPRMPGAGPARAGLGCPTRNPHFSEIPSISWNSTYFNENPPILVKFGDFWCFGGGNLAFTRSSIGMILFCSAKK